MIKKSFLVFLLCFGILIVSSASYVYSQRLTGSIRGTVRDDAGEALPGVTVEVSS